jgi:hypothetical protein
MITYMLKLIALPLLCLSILLAFSTAAKAACTGQNCLFPNCPTNSTVCTTAKSQNNTNPVSGPTGIINSAANIIAVLAGIIAVIMIIVSGIMYATAGGNQESTRKAQSTLVGAVIGLVIVLLAWTITRFIVDKVIQ